MRSDWNGAGERRLRLRHRGTLGLFPRRKKTTEQVQGRFDVELEALKEGWGPAAVAPEPDPPENLTIYDAVVWTFGESNCLSLPVVRVRLDAINSWWVGQGRQIKTGGSGPSFFAFVSVPIGQ